MNAQSITAAQLAAATEYVNQCEATRPDLAALAMTASLARRIEPELLRILRLTLGSHFQGSRRPTVGTESAVWFSPFVESRGPNNITFLPEYSAILRDRLRDSSLLEASFEVIQKCHQSVSPVVRWEEELVYIALCKQFQEHERQRCLEQRAMSGLKAILAGGRSGLEKWVVEMWPRLPSVAAANPALAKLCNVCAVRIKQRASSESGEVKSADLMEIDFSDISTLMLDVAKRGDFIRIGYLSGKGEFGIRVPALEPVILDFLRTAQSQEPLKSISISRNESVEVPFGTNALYIRTLDGRLYRADPRAFTRSETDDLVPENIRRVAMGQLTSPAQCYVLMPFADELRATYEAAIKPAINGAATRFGRDIRCLRADELAGPGSIQREIIASIYTADVVIADLTGNNPNVFYELGISHSIGNKTIMISQSIAEAPFDISAYRLILYEPSLNGLTKLRNELSNAVAEILSGQSEPSNPVQDFAPAPFSNVIISLADLIVFEAQIATTVWTICPTLDAVIKLFRNVIKNNVENRSLKYRYLVPNTRDMLRNIRRFREALGLDDISWQRIQIRTVELHLVESEVVIYNAFTDRQRILLMSPLEEEQPFWFSVRGARARQIVNRYETLWGDLSKPLTLEYPS